MRALMSSHGNAGTVVHRSTMLPSRILHVGPLYQLPTLCCVCVCGFAPGLGARLRISASCTLHLSSLPLSGLLFVLLPSPILLPPLGGGVFLLCPYVCVFVFGAHVFPRLPPLCVSVFAFSLLWPARACGFPRVVPCQSALSVYYMFLLLVAVWRLVPCRLCRHLAPIVLSMKSG